MSELEKYRRKQETNIDNARILTKYRKCDIPDNLLLICEYNLKFFNNYVNYIKSDENRSIHYDVLLVTYILNYISSIKSYLNRKLFCISKFENSIYKEEIRNLVRKFYSINHKIITPIDKLIYIRDYFEHEKIESIKMKFYFTEHKIIKTLYIGDENIEELFNNCFILLKTMNVEIENYINEEMEKLHLRESTIFINEFNKRFNIDNFIVISPLPEEWEIKETNNIIDSLLNKK